MKIYNAMLTILLTSLIAVSASVASAQLVKLDNKKTTYEESLLTLADQAMQSQEYRKAIGLYTKIINAAANPFQQIALENLGLARERNNQFAHAKAEYQLYLETYPDSDGVIRVKRRLENLIEQQRFGIAGTKDELALKNKWNRFGSLYQFYYRENIDVDNLDSIDANSFLSTNINYTVRTNNKLSPMEANVSATHLNNISNSETDEERLTSLYFYMSSENQLFDVKLGRQKNKTTSIFNRYDGIDMGYMMSADYQLKLVFGYPVEFNETVEDSEDKRFYSLGLGLFPNSKNWNTYLYYLEQEADNILDRQEISIDTKYQNSHSSFYSAVDYSLQFETLNFFLATFNKRYQDESSLNLIANYRKSPFLTTTNALQGQVGVSSLEDLLSTLTEDEIEQLSLDRTALYKSLSAYYTRYLEADLQLTSDITWSNMSGTIASAGVDALKDTGNEYSYSLGLIRNNLFINNDVNIVNLRYSQLTTSDILILSLSSRFRVAKLWRINPRLRYDTRDYDDGHSSGAIRPSISVKHKLNKSWQFEAEVSYEDKEIETPGSVTTNEKRKLFYAGYVFTF